MHLCRVLCCTYTSVTARTPRRASLVAVPSPIHDTIEDTHHNYDSCAERLLDSVPHVSAVIASHNEGSVERVERAMARRGLPASCPDVAFGQLLGMAGGKPCPLHGAA